jgi:hypothetical protein
LQNIPEKRQVKLSLRPGEFVFSNFTDLWGFAPNPKFFLCLDTKKELKEKSRLA